MFMDTSTKNAVSYCRAWFRAKKVALEPRSREEASTAHERRLPYVAIVGEHERPRAFVEMNADYVGVGFLDDRRREYLSYQFQELEPGKLFLTMATHREFDGDRDAVREATTYYFKPSGNVVVEKVDRSGRAQSRSSAQRDVANNWEVYPVFGAYDGVIRVEREPSSTTETR